MLRIEAGVGKDNAVAGKGGDVQGDGEAGLLRPFQVAGPAHLHVLFRDLETVLGGTHEVQALLRFLGYLVPLHEDAEGLLGAPAHPAAQLVQLAQAEPLGALDHHHRRVRDIHAHLDDGGGNEDVGPSGHEGVHVEGLLLRRLFPMDHRHLVLRLRELLEDLLVPQFQVLVVHFLALEDQGIHDEGLASLRDLVADEIVHRGALVFPHAQGLDRFPARRHLVDDGNVQVPVQGHGQGAGDRRRRHHEHMRRDAAGALRPKPGPLVHPEAVLLVHDGESEGLEYHRVLDEGMGPHDEADAAVLQPRMDLPPGRRSGGPGQEGGLHAGGCQVLGDIVEVLERKYFCRSHQAGLITVGHGDQGREYGDHRLAAAHIALQEPVHLVAALQVFPDFLDDALLRPGQVVGERLVAAVERIAHPGHGQAHGAPAADVFLLDQGKLQEEEFLELEAVGGLREGVLVRRKMDLPQGETQRHQPLFLQDIVRQRILQRGQDQLQGRRHQAQHHLSRDSARLELFRGRVDAGEDPGLGRFGRVELGMDHVDPPVERLGLSEKEEGLAGKEPRVHPFDALEEDDFHLAGIVADDDGQAVGEVVLDLLRGDLRPVFRKEPDLQDRADDLDVRLVGMDVRDLLDRAPVDVPERVQMQEVAHGGDVQFGLQERGPLGPHPGKVLHCRFHRLAHIAKIRNLS